MEGHLRLAEAKGSLTGRSSRVQDRALQIMLMLHRIERVKERFDAIKVRALTEGLDDKRLRSLFPEFFPEEDPFADAVDADGNVDPDKVNEDAIKFSLPNSAEEDEAISAWIREREAGSVSGDVMTDWV